VAQSKREHFLMTELLIMTLGLLFLGSFASTLLATPAICRLALRLGWMDVPDQNRKIHTAPIPRVGGIAVMLAYATAIGLLATISPQAIEGCRLALNLVWRLLPAAAVVFITGFLDDRFTLWPWQKMAGQLMAAALACLAGVEIHGIGGTVIPHWAGVPLTVIWLLACTNAFNLIDGMDGLASGVGLFATLTVLAASLLHGDLGLAVAVVPLAGALAGFLRFNLTPATVFLGDAGSLSVGFLLGCYGVFWSHKSTTMLGMMAPLMAMAVPLCDTAVAVARRFLRSKPIFGADRAHIHHRLLDLGLTPRRVVLLLYGASGLAAAFALLQSLVSNELRALVFLLFCCATWSGIRLLKYDEFNVLSDILRLRLLRGLLKEQLRLRSLEDSLSAAATSEDCWCAVRDGAREFGFNSIEFGYQGRTRSEVLRHCRRGQWSMQIPLGGSSYLRLTRDFQSSEPTGAIDPFIDFVHRTLQHRARNGQLDPASLEPAIQSRSLNNRSATAP
jgi:UDP-GlcNAc:undecaprenyl-phosphate GlcNAc-1-phosphate transferase